MPDFRQWNQESHANLNMSSSISQHAKGPPPSAKLNWQLHIPNLAHTFTRDHEAQLTIRICFQHLKRSSFDHSALAKCDHLIGKSDH